MSTKTVAVLTVMVLAGGVGDALMSKGMKQVGEITSTHPVELLRAGTRAFSNPFFIGGVAGLALYFFSYAALLSWEDVSVVAPISALSFVVTAFLAQHTLGENVSPQRWLGTLLIIAGVALIARSPGVDG